MGTSSARPVLSSIVICINVTEAIAQTLVVWEKGRDKACWPGGKRDIKEGDHSDVDCAIRETREETRYQLTATALQRINPLTEGAWEKRSDGSIYYPSGKQTCYMVIGTDFQRDESLPLDPDIDRVNWIPLSNVAEEVTFLSQNWLYRFVQKEAYENPMLSAGLRKEQREEIKRRLSNKLVA